MPSLAKLVAPLAILAASAAGLPARNTAAAAAVARTAEVVVTARDTPACPSDPNSRVRVWADEIYSLFPLAPDHKSAATQDLNVQYHNETRQAIKQVAVFRGFPSVATGCAFGWQQEAPTDGVIVTGGDGYLAARQLAGGFPASTGVASDGGVSLNDVAPFDSLGAASEFHPDFTNWDQSTAAQNHTSGPGVIECADAIALVFEKATTKTGHVYLKKTANAGIFIDYTCA
ncbi:hypothetical protein F4820DRAFT_129567 [Hypoxylon rubiginosum]|uniref:Uncharacterized protein n=1 Tax=Hypoxylon rubiginosum TaxID=110542 RepID=A0ACB9YKT5_9PEZI|nr:hypothetical protein F4820DRAFT_129567 [Hypoxylon rubiginosum]